MIRLLFLVFILCSAGKSTIAQKADIPIDKDSGLITWKEVVNESGTKDALYKRCIEWVNSYYKNPQEATKVRKPEDGYIVINHAIRMVDKQEDGTTINSNTVVNYILRLEFKENRYRYIFTDFTMKALSKFPLERWLDKKDPSYNPKFEDYLLQVSEEINAVIASLKDGMKYKPVKEDIW